MILGDLDSGMMKPDALGLQSTGLKMDKPFGFVIAIC